MTIPYVYDTGALIALDNGERDMVAEHRVAVTDRRRIIVPAVAVAQAWRNSGRQVQLGRFIRGCEVIPVDIHLAKAAGTLCGKAGTADVVDSIVATVALTHGAIVYTSDPADMRELSHASGVKPGLAIRTV